MSRPSGPAGLKKPDFRPVSKFITDSLPLGGILPVKNKHHIFARTAGAHCTIFPKLCTVIELVPIEIGVIHFFIQRVAFSTGCTEKKRRK